MDQRQVRSATKRRRKKLTEGAPWGKLSLARLRRRLLRGIKRLSLGEGAALEG